MQAQGSLVCRLDAREHSSINVVSCNSLTSWIICQNSAIASIIICNDLSPDNLIPSSFKVMESSFETSGLAEGLASVGRVICFLRTLFFCVCLRSQGFMLPSMPCSGWEQSVSSIERESILRRVRENLHFPHKRLPGQTKVRKEIGRWFPLYHLPLEPPAKSRFGSRVLCLCSLAPLPFTTGEKLPETFGLYWKSTSHCPFLCSTKTFLFP